MKKKAIAPLISTVALILFATGLGIIVMNWGTAASYAVETKVGCDRASVNVIEINNKPDVCFKDNVLYFTLENNGEIDVGALKISFIGDKVYQTELKEKFFVGGIKKINVGYEDVGKVLKVKIAPIIEGEICVKQSTSIENIEGC